MKETRQTRKRLRERERVCLDEEERSRYERGEERGKRILQKEEILFVIRTEIRLP